MDMTLNLESDSLFREQVCSHPIVASISEAVKSPSWKDPQKGHFTIPFYKPINGNLYDLWFRRRHFYPNGPEFTIDLGIFDRSDFDSVASIDFAVRESIDAIESRAKEKSRIGVVQRSIPMLWTDGVRCNRDRSYRDYEKGIYVKENEEDAVNLELRQKHIGTALVSAARAILIPEGVRQLIFDEITDFEQEKSVTEFYKRLGGRIFRIKDEKEPTPKLIMPTAHSIRFPYRFE